MEEKELTLTLDRIAFTLSQVKVSGEEDLSRMLGCIQTLRSIVSKRQEVKTDG